MEEHVLDEILDNLVGRGERTLEEFLEQFPAPSKLSALTEAAALAKSAISAPISPVVRAKHQSILMEAARSRAPQPVIRTRERGFRRWVVRPILAVGLIGALLVPTAAFAENATPGSWLYGGKLALEDLRLILETDEVDDIRLHLEFASERLDELAQMLALGNTEGLGKLMSNLNSHRNAAEDGLSGLGDEEEDSVAASLESVLQTHVGVLTALAEKAGCVTEDPSAGAPQCKGLLNAITNSSKVIEKHSVPGSPPAGTTRENEPASGKDKQNEKQQHRPVSPGKSQRNSLQNPPAGAGQS